MDLQEIEKEYPRRILDKLSVNHVSVELLFDLPRNRHLRLIIALFARKGERVLDASVAVLVTAPLKVERSETSTFAFAGEEKDIPRCLQEYLLLCVGDLEKHTYADGIISHLLHQWSTKQVSGKVD
jgi:hypothetical protein